MIFNGDLFELNKISHKDRLVNLGILLGNNNPDQNTTLLTNRDALTILHGNSSANDEGNYMPELKLNKIYVPFGWKTCYMRGILATAFQKNDDNSFRTEHLKCIKKII